jgi:hypothetical protein
MPVRGFNLNNKNYILMQKYILLFSFLGFLSTASAQRVFSSGFRAGLTFSTFQGGPSEMGDDGTDLENFSLSSGFHVGATFNVRLTDIFGLRAELLYAQLGTNYDYEGPSYWILEPLIGPTIYSAGTRRMSLDVTNSYLNVPVMAFARFGSVEFSGGINAGILVGSRGFGEITYEGRTSLGTTIAPFTINLEHRYFSDTYREKIAREFEARVIEGRPVEIPLTIGAYYEALDNGQKTYKGIDVGVIGGLSYYLNKSLFLGGRIQYGLLDVTNNQQDIEKKNLDPNRNYILRDDKDRNLALYFSLGFSF